MDIPSASPSKKILCFIYLKYFINISEHFDNITNLCNVMTVDKVLGGSVLF